MSLPIVFALVGDPVASGFVRSLPRPGTNANGLSIMSAELGAKRIEILNETFPNRRRVGVLHNPGESGIQLPFVQQSVRTLRKELMVVEARAPEDFAAALDKLAAWRADALVICAVALVADDLMRYHGRDPDLAGPAAKQHAQAELAKLLALLDCQVAEGENVQAIASGPTEGRKP